MHSLLLLNFVKIVGVWKEITENGSIADESSRVIPMIKGSESQGINNKI